MKRNVKWSILFLVVLILALPMSLTAKSANDEAKMAFMSEPATIEFVMTSDVHGSLFPYDFIEGKETGTSLAQAASYIKEARMDRNVVLLDNGDTLQGQPIVYYYNFINTEDVHIQAQVMNYLGYDAGVVGNHDVEPGHDVYDTIVEDMNFPWMAANALDKATGKPYFEPYTVINRGGLKIAVLGLTTPGVPNWLPANIWEGLEYADMIETAKKWVPIIMEKENPDLLVGLCHAGVDFEYSGTADEPKNENASLLVAEQVDGFDIIFTGHDHIGTNMTAKSPSGETVYIVGTLSGAKTVGSVKVDYMLNSMGGYDMEFTPEVVDLSSYEQDAEYLAAFSDVTQGVIDWVDRPIGTFSKAISSREAMFGDSPFVDIISEIQLDLTGADVSFCAPLQMDKTIEAGEVYVRDMFKLYKYENLLYSMTMTGREILGFMEYSVNNWFNTMSGPDDHLINFKKDDDGNLILNDRYGTYDTVTRYYNYDSAAGIDYTVDVSAPYGEKMNILGFSDGREFDLDAEYLVAINSYRGTGGGGHMTTGAGIPKEELESRIVTSTIQDLRYYLMTWIEEEGTVNPKALGNWYLIPEDWAAAGAEKSYPFLYQ